MSNNEFDQIENILDNFRFDKVRNVMFLLNWTWATVDGQYVPTVEQMKERARDLLERVQDQQFVNFAEGQPDNNNTVTCGGFRATAIDQLNGRRFLQLEFIVESWDTYQGN